MGYYINQKCGSCKKSLTGGYVGNYSGIGQPFVICPRCGTANSNADRVTEWELKSGFSKFFFVLHHVLSVIFYYGFGAGLLAAILLGADVISSIEALIAIIAVGLAFGLIRFLTRLRKAIQDSNTRMSDPSYVANLRRLGLSR